MAGKRNEYPPDEKLVELAKDHPNLKALVKAECPEIPYRSMQRHVKRQGIWKKMEARFPAGLKALPAEDAKPDVTSAEGRREANRQSEHRELRKENVKLRSLLLDQENLFDRFVAAAEERRSSAPVKVRFGRSRKKPGQKRRDVVLPLFDMQFGQRVRPEDTPSGIGGFDSSVFERRLKRYVDATLGTLSDSADSHTLDDLWIVFGGDMVEGDEIFAGQSWQLEMNPVDQVLGLESLLSAAVAEICRVAVEDLGVQKLGCVCVPGNHGKVGGKRGGARPTSYSWDYLLFRMLERSLSGIPFSAFAIEPGGACYFSAKGHTFAVIHGDEVRGHMSIPFYGLTRHDAKMLRSINTAFDYLLLGHHHQPASIPIGYGEHLMSGNWVGANNLSRFVGSNTPSQWAFFVSEDYGVGDRSLISLEPIAKPVARVHTTA